MYAITGVTGHVGGATARALLDHGSAIRAVVHDAATRQAWAERGAATAVADFTDRAALATALRDSDGAFLMLPTIATAGDAEHRCMAESIAAAVGDSGVPHVVVLSSLGADLVEGTGPIRWLHHLEHRIQATGAVVSAIRSPYFQEKVGAILGGAVDAGTYPVFGDSADVLTPMVATRDVGTVVAEALLRPPTTSEVIDLDAPLYTERDVADRLGVALGRTLEVVTIPRAGWIDVMRDAGLPEILAHEMAALYDAEQRGLLQQRGDRRRACTIPIEQTLRQVVATATGNAA